MNPSSVGKHRADVPVRRTPLHSYRPRHCSGVTPTGGDCLHEHVEDRRCWCKQVTLAPGIAVHITSVHKNLDSVPKKTRHSEHFCHAVSPASSVAVHGLQKAGA